MTTWDPSEIAKLRELKEKFKDGDGAGETPIGDLVNMEPKKLPMRKTCQMCGEPSRDNECEPCFTMLREREAYERGFPPT